MAAWLEGPVTTAAFCWRLERRDGVTVGLTSHDRDLVVDGLPYRASPGVTPSAVRREEGLEPDTADLAGALAADALTEADLSAGRWNGARVVLFAADWTAPESQVPLGEGLIGAVEMRGGAFTAELRGAAAALDRPVVEETGAGCRAELGDRRCRVAMAGRRTLARVASADGATVALSEAEPVADGWGQGRLRWLGGPNAGLEAQVARSAGKMVELRRAPPHPPAPGTLVEVWEGCDKRLETCRGRFGNAPNFRGEPFLPGVDLLTRHPGG